MKPPPSLATHKQQFYVLAALLPLTAHRRKSKAYRRMLFQTEAALKAPRLKMNGKSSQQTSFGYKTKQKNHTRQSVILNKGDTLWIGILH